MIESHFQKSRWLVIIGLPLQLIGLLVTSEMEIHPLWKLLGGLAWFPGTVGLGVGLSWYARAKGRDAALGWLALLSILGVLIVGYLPDLTVKNHSPKSPSI